MPTPIHSPFVPRATPATPRPSRASQVSGDPFGRLFDTELDARSGGTHRADAQAADARSSDPRAGERPVRRTESSRRRDDERVEPVGGPLQTAETTFTPQQIRAAIDDLADRIAGVVRARVDQVAPGHELRVAVDTGVLGVEEIAVRRTAAGQIEVVLGKTGADAQDLLKRHLGELSDALERSQIDVGRLHLLSADGKELQSFEPSHRSGGGDSSGSAGHDRDGRDGRDGQPHNARREVPAWRGAAATPFDQLIVTVDEPLVSREHAEARP
ncbi:MAG: hypothetical protein AAGC60_01700 [Acidobacteriota bacterium]